MTPKFSQVRLLVDDFPACFRFYQETLGFPVNFGDENEVYADFDAGGVQLALYRRDLMANDIGIGDKPAVADAQDRTSLTFEVENVDDAARELAGKGIVIVFAPTDRPAWGMRTAHFRDPSGNLLEIFHPIEMMEE